MKPLLCLLIFSNFALHAEIIKREAPVRQASSKRVVLTLKNGVRVAADPLRGQYYNVFLDAVVDSADVNIDYTDAIVRRGAIIWNPSGSVAGVVHSDLPAYFYKHLPFGKVEVCFFDLQVHKKYVDPLSDPERSLPPIVESGVSHLDQFVSYLNSCDYHPWIDSSGFKMYLKTGADIIGSPAARIFLAFYHDELFAILSPSGIRTMHEFRRSHVNNFKVSYAIPDEQAVMNFETIYFNIIRAAD